MEEVQQLEYLVLDSNAFIRGYGLSNLMRKAKRIITVEEVLSEIRDSKARETLQNLAFTLEIRTPSSTVCHEVASFAMKTGDFHSLSKADLKIIALTKMLKVETSNETTASNVQLSSIQLSAKESTISLGVEFPTPSKDGDDAIPQDCGRVQQEMEEENINEISSLVHESEESTSNAETLPAASASVSASAVVAAFSENTSQAFQSAILSKHSSNLTHENESKLLRETDDGVGWINMTNIDGHIHDSGFITVAKRKNTERKKAVPVAAAYLKQDPKVACYTSDFTMQNILLQMGLHVISAEGMLVKSIKKFVLRCNACFTVHTKELTRLFCSRCGSNHLSRISASVDECGKLRLHLKKNYHVDTTGMKYSLPAPGKQDRFQGELLYREDQLLSGIWRQKLVKINKDVKSAFGDDVTSDVGLHLNKQEKIVVGLGKSNPNARKGRERRGKKAR